MLFIFDLDDTIYDYMEPFKKTLSQLLGIDDPAACWELYQSYRRFSDQVFPMSQTNAISLEQAGYLRTELMVKHHGIDLDAKGIREFHETYRQNQQRIEIQPAIRELLKKLKDSGHNIAIITNGPGPHQARKIAQLNLEAYFNPRNIFISGYYGFDKPDHRIFDIAINRLRPKNEEVYYIGDNYHADVIGAKNAGLLSIWLKIRDFQVGDTTIKPDHTVESYQQLQTLIEALIGG